VKPLVSTLVLIAAAATAAIAANLALLRYGSSSNDPVGKLRPVAHFPAAPANVVRPTMGPLEHEHSDD
jgi:hypothetical protein